MERLMVNEFERDLVASLREAVAHAQGRPATGTREYHVAVPDLRAVRRRLGLTQAAFALAFGVPLPTLRNYEQGRRRPDALGAAYLRLIERRPDLVRQAVAEDARDRVSLVIAVDGPAAAGKGTLATRLAAHFGLPHLDTGLLYRATGRRVLDGGGDPADPAAAVPAARALHPDDLRRSDLRGPAADAAAAAVASMPAVRAALLQFQRDFARARGAVLDGRDIGTIVFPDAAAKLFVTASVEARGRRRWRELQGRGVAADLAEVIAQVRLRDEQDRTRAAAPLVAAADAIVLDTTELDADATFAQALALLRGRLGTVG